MRSPSESVRSTGNSAYRSMLRARRALTAPRPRALRSAAQGARGEGRTGFPGPAMSCWPVPESAALCQKGQKGRKGAQRHDTHALSALSDLCGVGAPDRGRSTGRWDGRSTKPKRCGVRRTARGCASPIWSAMPMPTCTRATSPSDEIDGDAALRRGRTSRFACHGKPGRAGASMGTPALH
jgi:hypothetical protein